MFFFFCIGGMLQCLQEANQGQSILYTCRSSFSFYCSLVLVFMFLLFIVKMLLGIVGVLILWILILYQRDNEQDKRKCNMYAFINCKRGTNLIFAVQSLRVTDTICLVPPQPRGKLPGLEFIRLHL